MAGHRWGKRDQFGNVSCPGCGASRWAPSERQRAARRAVSIYIGDAKVDAVEAEKMLNEWSEAARGRRISDDCDEEAVWRVIES